MTLIRRQAAPGARGIAPRRRRGKVAGIGALAVMLLALTGCTNDTFTRIGFPDPITTQGKVVVSLWQGSWIAGMLVGCVVWGLIVWAVIFHRKRGDKLPPQVRYNMPIEILYTVIPFVLIAVLFYYTAKDENVLTATPPNPDVTVNVVGFQWSWEFDYPQPNHEPAVRMSGDSWDPTKPDKDQNLPVLEIPVGERVQFNLTSPDVVHAFWVPEFLFKRDVIPGHPNHFQVTLTKTGTYIGHCSELCGVYHSRMLFKLEVVTPQEYQKWIALQKANQSTAAGSTS